MDRKNALKIVSSIKQGSIEELESKIGSSFLRDFELIGYITKGIDSHGENTWKITSSGRDSFKKIYSEPNLLEKALGLFCHYILRYA